MNQSAFEILEHIQRELADQRKRLEAIEARLGIGGAAETLKAPAAVPASPPSGEPPPPPPYRPAAKMKPFLPDVRWETVFGGNWMVKIGIAAILIGLAFFLALAIQNQWIGPVGQVVLGILVGLSLIAAGEYWKERYSRYAQALSGGGIGALYLSIYAAFGFYDLIGVVPALAAMTVVTIASAALAVMNNAVSLIVIGILGGFATPILLFEDIGSPIPLLSYIALLDLGILIVSRYRNWQPLILYGLVGTAALTLSAYGLYYEPKHLVAFEGFLSLYFLLFVASTIFAQIVQQKKSTPADLMLMLGNAGHYFGWTYILLGPDYEAFRGFFTAFLGGFYVLLAWLALPRREEDEALSRALLGIAALFLVLAVPVQLSDFWVTIAWAAQGLVLVWLGFAFREFLLRFFGLAVFILTAIRLLVLDTAIDPQTPLANERFTTFLFAIVAFAAGAWLYNRSRKLLRPDEKSIAPALVVAANAATLWIFSAEIISFVDDENAQNLGLSFLWMFYAIVVLTFGFIARSRMSRIGGIALFWFVILKVFLYDVLALSRGFRVASFLTLGVILLVAGYLYQRFKAEIQEFLAGEGGERSGGHNLIPPRD